MRNISHPQKSIEVCVSTNVGGRLTILLMDVRDFAEEQKTGAFSYSLFSAKGLHSAPHCRETLVSTVLKNIIFNEHSRLLLVKEICLSV